MEHTKNYGLIIWHLRKQAGLSIQKLAERVGKSSGWISEVENSSGTCRLTESEFARIVELLDGEKHREMFRTWVANHHNASRVDRTFDGAIIRYIRIKNGLSIKKASQLTGLSCGYLSKLEVGKKPMNFEMRKRLMLAYGYNPSSFKNLSADPVRSKAVPLIYKLKILLAHMHEDQVKAIYGFAQSITSKAS